MPPWLVFPFSYLYRLSDFIISQFSVFFKTRGGDFNEIAQGAMKSSRCSDEIFGVPPQMKLNPSSYPDEVGFHHEVISSHDSGIYPSPNSWRCQLRTDLVEKREQVFDLLSFFWRRHPDLNRGIEVLQTFALPLGHVALLLSGFPDYIIIFHQRNIGY